MLRHSWATSAVPTETAQRERRSFNAWDLSDGSLTISVGWRTQSTTRGQRLVGRFFDLRAERMNQVDWQLDQPRETNQANTITLLSFIGNLETVREVLQRLRVALSRWQCRILRNTLVYDIVSFLFVVLHTWKQKVKNKINTHTQTEEEEEDDDDDDEEGLTRVRIVTSSLSNRRRQENEQRKRQVKSFIAQTNTKVFGAHCCRSLELATEKVHWSSFDGWEKIEARG